MQEQVDEGVHGSSISWIGACEQGIDILGRLFAQYRIIESPSRGGAGMHYYKLPEDTICDLWGFEDRLDEADELSLRASLLRPDLTPDEVRVRTRASAIERAAALREQALQLYKGELCEGSTNSCVAQTAQVLEERYVNAALQQGSYWRTKALTSMAAPNQDVMYKHDGPGSLSPAGDKRLSIYSIHSELQTMWQEALRNYERVLRVDRYNEMAYIHTMECYAYLGNASRVEQIFNRCQDALHVDLLEAPSLIFTQAYRECKRLLSIHSITTPSVEEVSIF